MKIKLFFNKSSINRTIFCFKIIPSIITVFFLFLILIVKAEEKNTSISIKKIVIGKVVDAYTLKPISAAQLSIPSKNLSAVTDDNGEFILKSASTSDVLNVSAYDYNNREIPLQGKDSITIKLYSDQFSSYFKKLNGLSGLISNSTTVLSVKSIDNLSKSNAMVADEMFQTSLGGDIRSVSRSGVSGVGSSLFIRGINSINANAQPLFIVDGVIWENLYNVESIHEGFYSNPLTNIDVNDIESITVLKDGTSLYGSKASNGVILIKTKRATDMVTKISFNLLTGFTSRPSVLPTMKGEEFRVYASDMLNSKGVANFDISQYPFLETNPQSSIYNAYHNVTDWSDQVYQTGQTNSYLINANGGDDKALYYFSLGLTNNKGVVKSTDFQRINARFNADFKLINAVSLGLNIGFSRIERSLLNDGMSTYSSPTWLSAIKAPFLSPNTFTALGEKTPNYAFADNFGITNPAGLVYISINNLKNYRFNIGLLPTIKISPQLTLSSQFDYNLNKTIEGHYLPAFYTPVRMIENFGTSYNQITSQVMRNTGVYDDTRLTFQKKFDASNSLKLIYGLRYISNFYESDFAKEHNSGSNNNTTITGSYSYLQVNGINNHTKSLSNYLNVDYNFDNKYFINAVMSLDASSRFGKQTLGGIHFMGQSWGVFPSVNAAWLVTSEKFMKNIPVINFMKLRAGYGITGNDGIVDYESMAYFASVQFYGRANGLVLSNLENTKVQWENTARMSVGLDLGLLNDRINLSLDMYKSSISNLLVLKDLPAISGLGKYWFNGGEMTNNGFEFTANIKALNLRNLKWELGFSVGHYLNTVTSLPRADYTTSVYEGEVITSVGSSIGAFYGYKTNGVYTSQQDATTANLKVRNADGSLTAFGAGDMIFVDKPDANGLLDGIIDENDKQIIGNPNPDYYGNISSNLSYKHLTLSTIFTYSYGNDVYNYYRSQLEAGKDFSNQSTAMLTRWTADGQVTNQPKAVYGDPMGNTRFSDRWIEDGSFLRLKTITLSYELPIKSKYIEGINIWISGNNLLTYTNYLGLDPEVSSRNSVYYQGVDAGLVPLTKSYFIGIKFNL